MIVYGFTLSPFVRKVMAFGAEKGIALELQMAGMGRGGPDFVEASPFGKMPALRDGDFTVCDSSAIVQYLEAVHPEPALIPADPKARARTIWLEEFGDAIVMAAGMTVFRNRFVNPRVLGRDADLEAARAAERDELARAYAYLEQIAPDAGGFLVGDAITLADIAVASPIANMRYVGAQPDAAHYPRSTAYLDSILTRPSFAVMLEQDAATIARAGGALIDGETA